MEWFVLSNPVPAAAAFPMAVAGLVAVGFVAAVIPVLVAARGAWAARKVAPAVPQLRVVEGGRELSRRAA